MLPAVSVRRRLRAAGRSRPRSSSRWPLLPAPADSVCQAGRAGWRAARRRASARRGWAPGGWRRPAAHTRGRARAPCGAAPGRRRRPRRRPPTPRARRPATARVIIAVASAGLVANPMLAGRRPRRTGPGPRSRTSAGTGPVDQRVPAPGGVGQEHRDLGVLDPPRSAGVLALHPDRVHALLHVAGLVDHQHRVRVAEGVDDIAAQIVADRVGVPLRAGTADAAARPGSGIAAMLGDRPAVLAIQPGQHPQHQPGGMPQRLVAGEPRRDPVDHRAERRPPPVRIYPMSRGHRGVFVVPHKHRMFARWPPSCRRNAQHGTISIEDHELRLQY